MKNKDENSTKALKAGVWYTVSSFLRKGISFISTPIFARLLSKSEFGSYSNFAVWLSICAVVCTLNLKSSVPRARFDYEEKFDEYISSVTFFGTAVTALFYCIVIAFQDFFVNLLGIDAIYLHVMFIELLVAPALDNLQAKHRIMQKYKEQVALSIFITLSSTFFSVLGVYMMKDKLFGRIMGNEVTSTVIYLAVFIYVMYKGRKIIDVAAWKYAAVYSVPIIPHLLSNIILGSSDKVMITKLIGKEANAMYSIAYSGGLIISTLMTCFNQAMVPWLFAKLHNEDYEVIRKVNRYYVTGFSIVVMGAILLAPEITWVLGGSKYSGSEMVVLPVMLGYGFKFAYTNYVNVEQYEKKTGAVSVGTLIAAVFNIITNLIFIPIYGYVAAAYTTLAGFLMLLVMHYFISKKYGFANIYDNKFTFIQLALMSAAGLALQFLYPYVILRWGLAFILGVFTLTGIFKIRKQYFV